MRVPPESRFGFQKEDSLLHLAIVGEVSFHDELSAWRLEYVTKSDRFAELEAKKTGKQRWGRWYFDEKSNSLITVVCRPNIGSDGYTTRHDYDIYLDSFNGDIVEHMREKNWIGAKGLRDLERAIEDLSESRDIKPIGSLN